jgi:ADP-ribose pyrophosphatase YjhB (NUDIX family)
MDFDLTKQQNLHLFGYQIEEGFRPGKLLVSLKRGHKIFRGGKISGTAHIVPLSYDKSRVLIVRNSEKRDKDNPKREGWGCPTGSVELGETLYEAAWRELREESAKFPEGFSPLFKKENFRIARLPFFTRKLRPGEKSNWSENFFIEAWFVGQIRRNNLQIPQEPYDVFDVYKKRVVEAYWIPVDELPENVEMVERSEKIISQLREDRLREKKPPLPPEEIDSIVFKQGGWSLHGATLYKSHLKWIFRTVFDEINFDILEKDVEILIKMAQAVNFHLPPIPEE